ncbi:MAG: hypothetical protein ACLFTT_05055 [Candidatus Hydrogenedentota bacterium]
MIKDRIVRVKCKKAFHEEKPWCYVGKVTAFNDHWVVLEARGLMITRQNPQGVQVDTKPQAIMIPRENIETIRILPDNFDMANMQFTTDNQKLLLVVEGAPHAFIGVLGEG